MSEKFFSKKQAIQHGFQMTKKYFGVIFCIMVVYLAFDLAGDLLQSRAGENSVDKRDIMSKLNIDSDEADRFYRYLQEAGYINKWGGATRQLKSLAHSSDLTLPLEWEGDREEIFDFLKRYTYRLPFPVQIYYVLSFAFFIVFLFMSVGLIKIALMLARDQAPSVGELFANGRFVLTYLLGSVCFGLTVIGGMILLIIPGIILAIGLGMFMYMIVDQNLGPIASLNKSWALTRGVRWELFLLGLLCILLNIGGFLCLLVGLLFTIPTTSIAYAYVYDQLRVRE